MKDQPNPISKLTNTLLFLSFFCMPLFSLPTLVQAETFQALLPELLRNDPKIIQAEAIKKTAEIGTRTARAGWIPSVDVSGHYGYEEMVKHPGNGGNTYLETRKIQFKATQLLWDFGKTNVGIDQADVQLQLSEQSYNSSKQSLILDATTAYYNLVRTYKQLAYSQTSEANIRQQTGMEEARVQKGSGFSTDVLQTKSQLAGAMAARVRAEGALTNAINRYRRVFRKEPSDLKNMQVPVPPLNLLPATLDEVLDKAQTNNISLQQAELALATATLGKKSSTAQFFPEFKLIGQSQYKEDDGGTENEKDEHLVKVDFSYPLFSGGKNYYGLKSAQENISAKENALLDAQRNIEETARNSWQNYLTSRTNAQFLTNQANISGEFLALARKERQLGRRSLLDVLNGETSYINALSSAASAETDMALAVYNLFFVMGQLTEDLFLSDNERMDGKEAPPPATEQPSQS